jgi:hypothetical protein
VYIQFNGYKQKYRNGDSRNTCEFNPACLSPSKEEEESPQDENQSQKSALGNIAQHTPKHQKKHKLFS